VVWFNVQIAFIRYTFTEEGRGVGFYSQLALQRPHYMPIPQTSLLYACSWCGMRTN